MRVRNRAKGVLYLCFSARDPWSFPIAPPVMLGPLAALALLALGFAPARATRTPAGFPPGGAPGQRKIVDDERAGVPARVNLGKLN